MARYARLFPLRAFPSGNSLILKTPRSLYWARGALSVFASPVIGGSVVLLMLMMGLEDASVGLVAFASVVGFFVLWGIGLFALGTRLSERTVVTFDRATVCRPDGASVPTAAIALVRVRRREGFTGFHVLELVAPNGEMFAVHERLPAMPESLAAVASEVASWLGVPSESPPATSSSFDEKHAAVLCYLPIQGIFLIASLWFLATDRRPFVRFAAKQSLLHFAFSIVVLLVAIALGAVPVLLTEGADGPLRVLAIVWLVILLVAFAIWNVGAHIYACVQASRGRAWVMPWLRFAVRPLG